MHDWSLPGFSAVAPRTGVWIEIFRGAHRGNDVWVRADDPRYTAAQIYEHEMGHDLKETVDSYYGADGKNESPFLELVRSALAGALSDEDVKTIMDEYAADHFTDRAGSRTASDDYIFEEMFCDAKDGMNGLTAESDDSAIRAFVQTVRQIADQYSEMVRQMQSEAQAGGIRFSADDTNLSESQLMRYHTYVDNALKGKGHNKQEAMYIGKVQPIITERLRQFGVYLNKNALHEITDNNIRHLRNGRGIEKVGAYGITDGDIYAIPYIISNANRTFFRETSDGKRGVLYVLDYVDTTYYVEGIESNGILSGRQIIKVPLGEVPKQYRNDVVKEKALTTYPDELKLPETYAQSDTSSRAYAYNMPQSADSVKEKLDSKSRKKNETQGSTKFSMDSPVEESNGLVAVHNQTGEELQWSLDRGGFPMPSIAVLLQQCRPPHGGVD